jgi:hypothetical protein
LEKGKSTLKASTFDDLVAQLDEIKTITVAGGLDDALCACANAVRSNFKAAKDKKAKGRKRILASPRKYTVAHLFHHLTFFWLSPEEVFDGRQFGQIRAGSILTISGSANGH